MIPSFSDIEIAHDNIRTQIHKTPILSSSMINEICGCELYFKSENLQKTGSFKIRGATNSILNLNKDDRISGVVAHSSGNHAQALAYAAKKNNVKAYIVMPNNAPKVKINAVKDYGAEIIFCEPNINAREKETNKIIEKYGSKMIHPFNYFDTIAGQGTCAKELFEEIKELDYLITPIGGGGLMSGSLISRNGMNAKCKVFGVEPEEVDDAYRSLNSGKIEINKTTNTICDGLLTNLGELTFEIIKNNIDGIFLVNDREVREAQTLIMQRMKVVVEPSSATVLAAVIKNKEIFKNKKVGLIITGGNIDINL